MVNVHVFKYATIEEDEHEHALQEKSQAPKGNTMPKGIVSLEKLYDLQNRFRGPKNTKTRSLELTYEQVNLETPQDLKYTNLSTCCSLREKQSFIHLFKQYQDVFSWTYNDLKSYDTHIT